MLGSGVLLEEHRTAVVGVHHIAEEGVRHTVPVDRTAAGEARRIDRAGVHHILGGELGNHHKEVAEVEDDLPEEDNHHVGDTVLAAVVRIRLAADTGPEEGIGPAEEEGIVLEEAGIVDHNLAAVLRICKFRYQTSLSRGMINDGRRLRLLVSSTIIRGGAITHGRRADHIPDTTY